jgi:hypothetical protein
MCISKNCSFIGLHFTLTTAFVPLFMCFIFYKCHVLFYKYFILEIKQVFPSDILSVSSPNFSLCCGF